MSRKLSETSMGMRGMFFGCAYKNKGFAGYCKPIISMHLKGEEEECDATNEEKHEQKGERKPNHKRRRKSGLPSRQGGLFDNEWKGDG